MDLLSQRLREQNERLGQRPEAQRGVGGNGGALPNGRAPGEAVVAYAFDDFVFTTCPRRLTRAGKEVRLQPQAAGLLQYFLENPRECVSREEIRERVWGKDLNVEFEDGINFLVSQLRRALRDNAKRPRYLETIPRIGYRWVIPPKIKRERPRRTLLTTTNLYVGVAGATLVLLMALGLWRALPRGESVSVVLPPFRMAGSEATEAPLDHAVAAGVYEDLVANLLRRYADGRTTWITGEGHERTSEPSPNAARVVGTITHWPGTSHVNLRLETRNGQETSWANSYSLEGDGLAVWSYRAARDIGEALGLSASSSFTPAAPRVSSEVYEQYLRARYLARQAQADAPEASLEAERLLTGVISASPDFGAGHAALARLYIDRLDDEPFDEVVPRAKAAAERALRLDPGRPDALVVLGYAYLLYDWDPKQSRRYLEDAHAAAPAWPEGLFALALLESASGNFHRSGELNDRALRLDGGSPAKYDLALAWDLYRQGRELEAAKRASRVLSDSPGDFTARFLRLQALSRAGETAALAEEVAAIQEIMGGPPLSGIPEYWERAVANHRNGIAQGRPEWAQLGYSLNRLGRIDEAVDAFARACEAQDSWAALFLGVDPEILELARSGHLQRLAGCFVFVTEPS